MKTLRTAVIGLGRIGWAYHAPSVARHEGFRLAAVVDPLQERLDEAKAEYSAEGYRDHTTMLEATDPDLVVIASPTEFHEEQAVAALRHGSHVFCDKPMAASLSGADNMIAAMRRHGGKLMVYQPHRAGADVVALRHILGEGVIGPIYMVKRANSRYSRRNDWQSLRSHGGGMLNNYGAHYIDQSLYVTASKARKISCALRTVASLGDAEDVVKAVIETESGVILDVDINQAAAHTLRPWQVFGRHGSLTLEDDAWRARFFDPEELKSLGLQEGLAAEGRDYDSGEDIPWQEKSYPLADYQPVDFYRKCYEYYALDMEPFVPVEETRELMRVLEECRKTAAG